MGNEQAPGQPSTTPIFHESIHPIILVCLADARVIEGDATAIKEFRAYGHEIPGKPPSSVDPA